MSHLEWIKQQSNAITPEVIGWRQHLHAHPELSFQEFETAKFIARVLREMGLEPKEGIGGTGIVALIEGQNPLSKSIALRADMDALPIEEKNDIDYKSKNIGVMHACGHDVHTASLLGTAKILFSAKDRFEGTVKLLFQPAEEKNPGGASLMIKDGALTNPTPDCIIGQHVFPLLPVGKIGFKSGQYMASADEIYLRVIGKGGHAAMPELIVDPVLITSHIIVALQQVVSRNANPRNPTVLSFGKIISEGATNVVPNEVNIAGTFRTMDDKWRKEGLIKINKIAQSIAEGMGGKCEVEISHGYPYLNNDPQLTQRIRKKAEEYMGTENVVDIDMTMSSEDFAYYSKVISASLYRLGTRNESKGITNYVHTPNFNIDEDALSFSTGLMAWMALNELSFLEMK